MRFALILFVFGLCISSLQPKLCAQEAKHYLFTGHTYDWHSYGSKVDKRLVELDKSRFDRIWLGGDICSEAMLNYSTIVYIDSLFDIGAPGNHYALGNHDTRNGNIDWYRELTGRETYYTYEQDGITTILMNTCIVPSDCEHLDKQFRMIENVCDTIQNSSHLILIMHHALCYNVPGIPSPNLWSHTKFPYWNANCYYRENNSFVGAIYPMLLDVLSRGIEVLCLIGDIGANGKLINLPSDDGVFFLGCGLDNSRYTDPDELAQQEKDLLLIFKHDIEKRQLTWSFQDLDSLLQVQRGMPFNGL